MPVGPEGMNQSTMEVLDSRSQQPTVGWLKKYEMVEKVYYLVSIKITVNKNHVT